jgi:hypothetical protein
MSNPLDDVPEREPAKLVAGDTWRWKRKDLSTDYPPAQWTLKYQLLSLDSPAQRITLTATNDGGDHLIDITASATAGYAAGRYRWELSATRTSDNARVTIERGIFLIKPNFATAAGDVRTHAEKMLALIEAELERRMTGAAIDRYAIRTEFERELTLMDVTKLYQMRSIYRSERDAEYARRIGASARKKTLISMAG